MNRALLLGLLLAASPLVAACSGSVVTDARRAADVDVDDGVPIGAGNGFVPVADLSPCAVDCEDRGSPGCFGADECTAYCEAGAPQWSAVERAAFASCAASDPLCYSLIEDCMIGTLYPDPIEQTVTVQAKGFEALEGRSVRASIEVGGQMIAAAPQVIEGGAFSVSWTVTMNVGAGQLVLYYVDDDGDGACSATADVTGTIDIPRPAGFGVPAWSAEVDGPMKADFVCQYL